MPKSSEQTQKRGNYYKPTQEERYLIISLKEQNYNTSEISNITGIKKATIHSINQQNRKKVYDKFENTIINDTLDKLISTQVLKYKSEKQQRRIIKQMIQKEFIYETSNYKELLEHKKDSKRTRKLLEIVNQIQLKYQQHNINNSSEFFLTENFNSVFDFDCQNSYPLYSLQQWPFQ